MLSSVQEELVKEKSDRSREKDSFQAEISQLVKERDEKDKNIKELNGIVSSRDADVIASRNQVEEV